MHRDYTFTNGNKLQIGTMYCIGKNYADHAKEMGGSVPKDPVVFIKPPAAYIPNKGTIRIPDFSNNVHHEVELVIIIGKDCSNISPSEARDHIAGYAVGIDVTLRDVQQKAKEEGKPWTVSKAFVTSAPISDVIPAEEFGDNIPYFDIALEINEQLRQKGNTKDMARPAQNLISYLSKVFTLQKGDCIFTGTPKGVGQIHPGDQIHCSLNDRISLNVSVK